MQDNISSMDINQILPMQNIFLMIIIIITNYLTSLYSCKFQNIMENNMYVKHLFGYLIMVFFVTVNSISSQITEEVRIKHLFLYSIIPYIFFIMTSKIHFNLFIPTLILLSFCYLLSLYKSQIINSKSLVLDENKKKNILEDIEFYNKLCTHIIIIIVIIGLIFEIYSKKKSNNNFNILHFLVGTVKCTV